MPKIKTEKGIITFKTRPLFPGVKRINKCIALENLFLLKEILERHNIRFMLTYGTLLGAVREKDFIDHDEDIDIALKEEYRNTFLNILNELKDLGFEIVRFDRRDLYSIMRKGEYIDLYFFHQCINGRWECSGELVLDEFMKKPDTIYFHGIEFQTHSNHEDYLVMSYGPNWRTPIQWNNYEMPKWKLLLLNAKEYAKDLLPDWAFYPLAKRAQKKLSDRCEKRFDEYFNYKKIK